VGRKIAAAEAEVAETAIHRWVVRFGIGKLAVQPLVKNAAVLVGGVFETDTGLIVVAFPCQISLQFELPVHARQIEREAERALFRDVAGKLNRHAAFAEVDGLGIVPARPDTLDRNLHRDPQLQPPFPLHQGSNRTKAGFGALHRERFVENEMGSHFEPALESDWSFHQHDPESPLVDRSGFSSPQHGASILSIRPIHDDGLETLAGDSADGIVRVGAMFEVNFKVAEDPAQDSHRPGFAGADDGKCHAAPSRALRSGQIATPLLGGSKLSPLATLSLWDSM